MASTKEATTMGKAASFLAILIASIPEEEFSTDASRWTSAILHLRSKYGKEHPHLFRYLHFKNMPKSDSYCPEVSNFLDFLQFADTTAVPGLTKMLLQVNTRELLRERYGKSLRPKDLSAVKRMGKEILPQIKV